MDEPNRPPLPKAYVPTKLLQGAPKHQTKPGEGDDPPIPPRPPPESIPPEAGSMIDSNSPIPVKPQRTKKRGSAPHPPPPYASTNSLSSSKSPTESNTVSDDLIDFTNGLHPSSKPNLPLRPSNGHPPPVPPSSTTSSVPPKPQPYSSSNIDIVTSAKPITSELSSTEPPIKPSPPMPRKPSVQKRGPPPPKPKSPAPPIVKNNVKEDITESGPPKPKSPAPPILSQQKDEESKSGPPKPKSPVPPILSQQKDEESKSGPPKPKFPAPPILSQQKDEEKTETKSGPSKQKPRVPSQHHNKNKVKTTCDFPPPSYPPPPVPKEETDTFPPKPTSPAPPLPKERRNNTQGPEHKPSRRGPAPSKPVRTSSTKHSEELDKDTSQVKNDEKKTSETKQESPIPTRREGSVRKAPPPPSSRPKLPPTSKESDNSLSKIEQTKIENEEKQIKTNIENNQKKIDRPKPPPPRGSIGSRPKPPVPTVSKPPPSTNSPPIDKKDSTEISLSKDYVKQKNECKTQEQLQPVIYDRPKPPPPRGSVGSRPKPPVPQSVSPALGKGEEENKTETTPPSVQTSQPINKSPQLSSQRSGSMSGRPRPPPPQTQVPQQPTEISLSKDEVKQKSESKTQEQLQPVIYDRPKPPPPRGSVGSRPKPPVPQSVSPVLGKEEEENKTETTPPSVQKSQPINKSPQLSSQRSGSMSGRPRPPPPQTQVPQPPKKSPTLQDKTEKDSTSSQSTPPPVKKNVAPVSHKSSPPVRPSNPPPKPSKAPSKNPTPPLKPGPPKPAPQRPGPPNRPPKPGPPKPGPPRPAPHKTAPVPTKRSGTSKDDPPPSLPSRPGPGHPLYKYVCAEPHGIANTNKESEEEDELSYEEGDVIELIENIDDYWYLARNVDNDNQEGLILVNDMKIIKRLPGEDKVAGFEDGPCAVAMKTFEARDYDELSFKEGDLIMLISRIGDTDWLRGRLLKGTEGIFPSKYVEIVEDLPPDAVESTTPESPVEMPSGPHCIAIEPFIGDGPDDLSFEQGDVIELLQRIDENWLRGKLNDDSGMFPQNFVDIKIDIQVESEVESTDDNLVTAVYEFDGQEGELSFKTGEQIQITYRINDEWVYGMIGSNEGMFPIDFVDRIPENLSLKPKEEDTNTENVVVTGKCEAIYEFEAENSGELSFVCGEIITTTEWINEDWMNGKIEDREGIFPLAFVKVIDELPKQTPSPVPKKQVENQKQKTKSGIDDNLLPRGVATHDFKPKSSEEIALMKGDDLYLLTHEGPSWYMGENLRTGEIGNIPSKYVEVIIPLP